MKGAFLHETKGESTQNFEEDDEQTESELYNFTTLYQNKFLNVYL